MKNILNDMAIEISKHYELVTIEDDKIYCQPDDRCDVGFRTVMEGIVELFSDAIGEPIGLKITSDCLHYPLAIINPNPVAKMNIFGGVYLD